MRILSFPPSLLFNLLFFAFSTSIFAQQNPVVQLEGVKMRAALELPKGTSNVTLCGLEPGNSYKVIAVPMAYGQDAGFEIAPAPAFSKGTSSFAFMRERKNEVRFAAPSDCVEIQVRAISNEQGDQIPMYLSILCENCPEVNASLEKVAGQSNQASLEVQHGFSAEELVQDVLVGGGCFQISNVSFSGQAGQIGTFSNGLSNIGFSNGLIMATGDISVAPGPNDFNAAGGGYGIGTPDADLQPLANGPIFDMANIEFDFVPTQNTVAFEFVFASEEYCEYVNSQFNDVFGFFISGPGIVGTKNIAVIPATNTPITINSLNHLVNSGLYIHNTPITGNNCLII
ncbi:MAG: choice-of-anchor L domain-containing protein, partial [Phycisphaerae bacterium]|nr:choice-of-anchor L domain-containing protein [Saprospiraceae bacterium]